MTCSKCGTHRNSEDRFCSECGAPYKNHSAIVIAVVSRLIAVCCALLMFPGCFQIADRPVDEIPIANLVARDPIGEVKALVRDGIPLLNLIFRLRHFPFFQEFSEEEYALADQFLDKISDCYHDFSLRSFKPIPSAIRSLEGTELEKAIEINKTLRQSGIKNEMLEIIPHLIDFLTLVLPAIGIFFLLFSVLGGLFLARGVAIAGGILTTLYYLLFSDLLSVILNLVLHAILIVFLSIHYALHKRPKY